VVTAALECRGPYFEPSAEDHRRTFSGRPSMGLQCDHDGLQSWFPGAGCSFAATLGCTPTTLAVGHCQP
jgi:hypothetical protein